jgi:opacity protein-like surface antigen
MKKQILLALPIIAITSIARADMLSPYVSLKLGGGSSSWENSETNPSGASVIGAVGATYALDAVNLRGELEFSYSSFTSEEVIVDNYDSFTIDQKFTSYMTNFYVDFLKSYKIKPYVGFGLGMMGVKNDVSENVYDFGTSTYIKFNSSANETALAYGLNGGFGFNFTDSLSGDLGIKYTIGAFENTNINVFTTAFGIRYKF